MLAKILDFILSKAIIFILSMLLISIFTHNIWLNIALSGVLTILISSIFKILSGKISKRTNYKKFETYSIVKGNDYILSAAVSLLDGYSPEKKDDRVLCSIRGKDAVIIPSIKFGNVGADEILKINRKYSGIADKIYIIATNIDRKALLIMNNYAEKIIFISLQTVYKALKKKKLLPNMTDKTYKSEKFSSQIFNAIFTRHNAKRFFAVAAILGVMSVILPLKAYYLTLCGINIFLTLICLIRNKSIDRENKTPFDR